MDGFLTNTAVVEPEIKESAEIKKQIVEQKINIPKPKKKTNVFRALLIGLLLLGLLAGAFVAYDKYQKGELKLDNLNLPFLGNKTNGTNTQNQNNINADLNRNNVLPDTNSDRNSSS